MRDLPLRVLVVEDRPSDVELVMAALRRDGLVVRGIPVATYEELATALTVRPHLVLCDHHVPGMSITHVLRMVRSASPGIPLLVVTGALDDDTATALLEQGVTDVLLKDRLARLGPAVRAALETQRLELTIQTSRAEQARLEGLLTSLVQNSPAAIGLLDEHGQELFVNERFRTVVDERVGLARVTTAASGSEIADGDDVHLVSRFAVEGGVSDTTIEGFILTDISRQKSVEAELRSTQAELRMQSRELRHQNEELRQVDRLKSDLVSTVSHELRTPLTSILGFAEMAEEHLTRRKDDVGLQMIGIMQRNGERLLTLVNNLLELAAVDQHSDAQPAAGRVRCADVDVNRLVSDVCATLQPSAQRRAVAVTTVLAPDVPVLSGDPELFERVLLNLGSNAVKFSKQGGSVIWRTWVEADAVVLEVRDDGLGIAAKDLHRVGARFFRSEAARVNQVPGTGLGLAVARSIVEEHGGQLRLASSPGEGTCATVRLPVNASAGVSTV